LLVDFVIYEVILAKSECSCDILGSQTTLYYNNQEINLECAQVRGWQKNILYYTFNLFILFFPLRNKNLKFEKRFAISEK
jgi:hypothetical protein